MPSGTSWQEAPWFVFLDTLLGCGSTLRELGERSVENFNDQLDTLDVHLKLDRLRNLLDFDTECAKLGN